MYIKDAPDVSPIFLILYVDNMLLSSRHIGELAELQRQLLLKFAMKHLDILRMKITRNRLSQSDYIQRILE
mgnify:CR=1 FL=1